MTTPTTETRVLTAIREHLAATGLPPSQGTIASLAGIAKPRVGRYLDTLMRKGVIRYRKGVPLSIELVRRGGGLSDAEVRAECITRFAVDPVSHGREAAVAVAFPIEAVVPGWAGELLGMVDGARNGSPDARKGVASARYVKKAPRDATGACGGSVELILGDGDGVHPGKCDEPSEGVTF